MRDGAEPATCRIAVVRFNPSAPEGRGELPGIRARVVISLLEEKLREVLCGTAGRTRDGREGEPGCTQPNRWSVLNCWLLFIEHFCFLSLHPIAPEDAPDLRLAGQTCCCINWSLVPEPSTSWGSLGSV